MTRALPWYLSQITGWQRKNPRFVATVSVSLAPFCDAAAALAAVPAAFDLDSAEGVQLDVDGLIIGQGRDILRPIAGPWFAFDEPDRGFDMGVWRGPYDVSVGTYTLDDARYRRLLRARVFASRGDGTVPFAQRVLNRYFDGTGVRAFVEDRCGGAAPDVLFAFDTPGRGFDEGDWEPLLFAFDTPGRGFDESRWMGLLEDDDQRETLAMELSIIVAGGPTPDPIDLAVLSNGLLPIKPQGVSLTVQVASEADAPMFGFDADNDFVSGFDQGAFGVAPDDLVL